MSLAPSVSTVELKQLQLIPGSPIALARESLLIGVIPDSQIFKSCEQDLKKLLNLLSGMEVRGRLLRVQRQKATDGK